MPHGRVTAGPLSNLAYTLSGDPEHPAVLLLHGFLGRAEDWRGVAEELEGRRSCVAVDLPGHGASLAMPHDRYTMEGAARSVLGVLDGVGVDRATLVGYSMGGRVALYLALRHPDRCAGLFIESASPGLASAEERALRRRDDREKARRLETGDLEAFVRDWYGQPLFAPLARDGELLRRTVESRLDNDPAELAKSLRGMGTGSQTSLWEELPGLQVPTLAVAGGLDEKFVGISRRMGETCQRVSPAIVPGVGHNVRAEAPGKYLALVGGFIGAL